MRHALAENFAACAAELRAAGFRVRTFVRASNPLNYDSAVRPVRDMTKHERLSNSVSANWGTSRCWLWGEHTFAEWEAFDAICARHGVVLSSTGYPQEGPDAYVPPKPKRRRRKPAATVVEGA
jgi:hypothetical protein